MADADDDKKDPHQLSDHLLGTNVVHQHDRARNTTTTTTISSSTTTGRWKKIRSGCRTMSRW